MILFKKAIRSMLTNKKAYIACIVLIMIGIFVFVSLGIASYSLDHAKNVYYEEYSFPDCFASVNAIATTEVETLANIGGIEKASGRLVYDSRVIFEDNDEIITLRLSTSKEQVSGINDFYLAGGNYLSDINDIMLSEEFLLAHNLAIGGTIKLNIEGKEYTLNICGAIQSPEYVYAIKDEKTVLPDPATFSFAFLTEGFLSSAVGKQGIYNDLSFILESGTTFGEIEIELEDTLNRYGLTKLYDRDEHLSYVMLDTEVESNKSMVTVIPSVFIMMSMAILYLMLKRVIEQERTQIGTLKAFGYSNLEIVSHYLMYGLITGFIGGLLGVILGYFIADTYIDMYSQFYKMPSLVKVVDPYYIIWGLLISVMGGALGSYMGARGVIKLDPADSMRSKAPKLIRHDILLVFPFLKHLITSRGSMAIRSIQRSKFRSLFIIIGIMFSFSLMAFMGSFNTMIDAMMLDQFQKIQVYDVKISFKQPVNFDKATDDIKNIRHVTYAEALFETPVLLKNKHLNTGISIVGMDQGSLLYKIYDSNTRKYLKPPTGGVIISDALARELGAKRGDYLIIESQFSSEEQKILVWDVVTQNLGMGCYMEANAMSEFFETQKLATSVIFRSDDIGYVRNEVIDGKNIASIENSSQTLQSYLNMLSTYTGLIWVMNILAIIVAFAIIYNTSVISLSEREREFATLRVLGLQIKEVSEIMSFEYWVLCFFGIILGFPFNDFLKLQMSNMIEVEMFSIPTYTPPEAYVNAIVGCIAAVFISNFTASRNIKKFDMVEVLKERE